MRATRNGACPRTGSFGANRTNVRGVDMGWVISATFLAAILAGPALVAQNAPQPPDITLDAAARSTVIDGALKALTEAYVFPEVAQKMVDAIRARQQRHEYDAIASGRQFAQLLTE